MGARIIIMLGNYFYTKHSQFSMSLIQPKHTYQKPTGRSKDILNLQIPHQVLNEQDIKHNRKLTTR